VATLFISDLHLEAARPEIGEQFLEFLGGAARRADALYILGDLFEAWIGDDDPSEYYAGMKQAIRGLADTGVPVFFMHGNRDFLIGERFADEAGVTLLEDPHEIELFGEKVLLSHGDFLCTDDVEYQQVRAMTRNPDWQAMMLAKSIEERSAVARQAREQSMAHGQATDMDIMDVNPQAVEATIREHGCDVLLHGHTHRPAVHPFHVDGRPVHRVVLGDWYEQGSMVEWDDDGPRLEALPRP
jgi:UDP-2,3-diacylglucosamine hydrolase